MRSSTFDLQRRRRRAAGVCLQVIVVVSVVLVVWSLRGAGDGSSGWVTAAPTTEAEAETITQPDDPSAPGLGLSAGELVADAEADSPAVAGTAPSGSPRAESVPSSAVEARTANAIVPDVLGMTGAEAARSIRAAGLVANCDALSCDAAVVATFPDNGQ